MRDRIAEFEGADIALITFTRARNVRGYRARLGLPFAVLADEERATYRDYGLGRGPWWRVYGPSVWLEYGRLVARGRRLQRPHEDTLQLGGDFVIAPDGRLAYAFRSTGPHDRPSIDDLIAAL